MGFLDDMKGKAEELKNKAEEFAREHSDQIEQGLQKAGDFAKQRFGHEEQVDKAVHKAKEFLGGDQPGGKPDQPGGEQPGSEQGGR